MKRLCNATLNSARAFRHLAKNETAFQQELLLLTVAIPAAWIIAPTWRSYGLLVGVVLFVMIVEVLNTAVEAACNALTRDFNEHIRLAKDCGSLAVSISLIIMIVVWAMALWEWWSGSLG